MSTAHVHSAHARADDLLAYVLDTLEPAAKRALERHVEVCDRCATALGAAAADEVAFAAAWSAVPRPLAPVLTLPPRMAPPIHFAPPPPVRQARPRTHRLHGSSSWSNGIAAAILTVLFVGYWHDGHKAPGTYPGARDTDAAGGDAVCVLGTLAPLAFVEPMTPVMLASRVDGTAPREPDEGGLRACLTRDGDALCRAPMSCVP